MAFDQQLIEDVLTHADIVKVISSYITLTKKGSNYWGICPFHDDTKPSLCVSPTKRMFNCFVCHTGGSAIKFVQLHEHISFGEALKKVAELSDYHDQRLEGVVRTKPVDPKKAPLLKCLHDLTVYYQYALNTEEGEAGLKYFESRHLDSVLRTKYRLGYANKNGKSTCDYLINKGNSVKAIEETGIGVIVNGSYVDKNQGRVIFPVCDADGNVVGFSARRIVESDDAKYINTKETYLFRKSTILYNYHIAKEKARSAGYIYVCEGFMDVFALARIGIDSAVATMGTALTSEHIALLRNLNVEIRLCLDGDKAGQDAMMSISKALNAAGLSVRIVDNQNNPRDPDEILNQNGEGALRSYLNNLISRVDFALNYFKNTNPLTTVEQKKALIKQFIPILLGITEQLELDSYLRKLSDVTGFNPESIRKVMNDAKTNKEYENPMQAIETLKPEEDKEIRRLKLAEKELLYQMMNNPQAVTFYEDKIGSFYDEVYRQVANYIVDYVKSNGELSAFNLLSSLETSDLNNKDEMINELANLSFEKHNDKCSQELLDNLLSSIEDEKDKIFQKDVLTQSLEGKDPLEKARIMAEYNRRKMKKLKQKENNEKEGK